MQVTELLSKAHCLEMWSMDFFELFCADFIRKFLLNSSGLHTVALKLTCFIGAQY